VTLIVRIIILHNQGIQGDFVDLQRSTAMLPHGLDPKGFYPAREKPGFELMT
jgi:hypothetical protein